MKMNLEEMKWVISVGLCSFILQLYSLFTIFTLSYPFHWTRALAWLIPRKTLNWCLVPMKMSSRDTEVMATAPHAVAFLCCALHHFEIRLV